MWFDLGCWSCTSQTSLIHQCLITGEARPGGIDSYTTEITELLAPGKNDRYHLNFGLAHVTICSDQISHVTICSFRRQKNFASK